MVSYLYNGRLLSHEKNEIMLLATTWIDLEIIILSEISQRKTNIMISLKGTQMNLFTKQTHRHRKQSYGYKRGNGGRDKLGG